MGHTARTHRRTSFRVRRMTRDEMEIAVAWTAVEGWNPGLNDAECFYNTDPQGFFIGELDGQPVGSISAVAYDDTFGFAGLYIVVPHMRRKGYGTQLYNAAMDYMGDRNVGGDGVVAMLEKYEAAGFHPAYRNIRFEGRGGGEPPKHVVSLLEVPFESVLAYDTHFFPVERATFLCYWLDQPATALGAMSPSGELAGYGVIRPCWRGYKIGPLFADGPDEAEALFRALAAQAPGAPVFLDTPEVNPAAIALAERHGMRATFETARMYTKEEPAVLLEGIFGVTSFELG